MPRTPEAPKSAPKAPARMSKKVKHQQEKYNSHKK